MRKILSFLFAALFALAINAETWEAGAQVAASALQAGDVILLSRYNDSRPDGQWLGGYHTLKSASSRGATTGAGADYSLGVFTSIKNRSAFRLVAGPTMNSEASYYLQEVTTGKYITAPVTTTEKPLIELTDDIANAISFVPTVHNDYSRLIYYDSENTAYYFGPFGSSDYLRFGTSKPDDWVFYYAVEKSTSFKQLDQVECTELVDGMALLFRAPYMYKEDRAQRSLGDQYLENTQVSSNVHGYVSSAFSDRQALATSLGYDENNVWILEYASPATTEGYSDYFYMKSQSTGEYIFRDIDQHAQSSAMTADKTKAATFTFGPGSVKKYTSGYAATASLYNDKTVSMINDAETYSTYKYFGSAHGYGFAVFNSENFANWNLHKAGTGDKVKIGDLYYILCGTTAMVTYTCDEKPSASGQNEYTGDIVIPATVTYGGNTYTVTEIGEGAFFRSTITSVVIPEGVTFIGKEAFARTSISSIEFPNSVKTIKGDACAYCNSLKVVTIGENVQSITQGLCYGTSVADVYSNITGTVHSQVSYMFPDNTRIHVAADRVNDYTSKWTSYYIVSDYNGVYYSIRGSNATVTYPGIYGERTADKTAVYSGDIVIPSTIDFSGTTYTVTAIGNNAFSHSAITSLEIPNSVTVIEGDAAAYINATLATVTIGSGVTSVSQGFCWGTTPTDVYIKTASVPAGAPYMFSGFPTLHVYDFMIDAFREANFWKDYTFADDLPGDYAALQAKAAEAQGYALLVGNNPGQFTPASYAAVENALASYAALDAASPASAINASLLEFSNAIDVLLASTPNPITEGYYFIVCDNANIAANGKPEKALYANKDLMQLYWGELETADLKYVFRFTDNGDGTWNLQNMDNGLYAGAATGFCVETSVTETADYPVTFYFDGEGSYRIKANNWTYCPHGNPNGNQDGPSYVWGYNAEGIHGEASYTLRAIDAATMNSIIGSMITDMDEITTSDDPGRYTATSVATYNTALNTAKEAVTAGTADMTTYEGLLAAKNQLVTNPITEGYYFIASAGNGPGYSGGPYEYEDDDAMYNADGIVKWKAYDSTDASQLYYLTQKEGNSWYVYNVMDATYIDNGGTGNSSTVRTSTDKVNGQEFHPMVAGTGKFAIKSPSYCYGLAANHNGSPNAEGNLCIWGTVNDCYSFGVNVWYLHKISNADAEQMIADAVANTNSVVAMPTNETGNHTNVIVDGVCSDLVLTDGLPFSAPSDFTATTATYTRAMSNEWGTICLPYEVSGDATTKYYTISAIENNSLVVSEVATLTAGTPALVQKLSGDAITATAANVPVSATIAAPSGTVEMYGVYERTKVEDPNAYYIKDNKFWQCNNYFFCGAFRAYFTTSGAGSNSFSIIVDNDDPTAIAGVEAGNDAAVAIYSTDGTRLGTLRSGINIVKQADGKTLKIQVK